MDQHCQPRRTLESVAGATVEVVAAASSAIDPTDVKTATNYNAERIDSLPMGRTVFAMAQLTPGVTSGVNDLQIRGSNGTGNLYLVDGQNLHDNVYNSLAFPIINDSIDETQIITGAISAEYGNVEGGVINTVTKSGGNEFTGLVRIDLSNPQWNAVRPMQNRNGISNILSEVKTYTLGGYIVKDRLWFYASYYTTDAATARSIAADALEGPGGANTPYTQEVARRTKTFKLTYRFNDDHSVIGTYSGGSVDVANVNYLAGTIGALSQQMERYEMYNFSWRSVWSPSFNSEIRFGTKTMLIGGGPKGSNEHMVYNLDDDYIYHSALFNGDDGGDNRDNQTANIKGSYFADWNGMHEIDFGFDYYKGSRYALNMQSPTNKIFYVEGWDIPSQTGYLVAYEDYVSTDAKANQTTMGLYVNDKWKLNNNLAVQVGFRWDQYKADSEDFNGTIASASGFSPRLGVTYDLFGDQQWIFKASYCIYHGAVLESITGAVSGAGNPKMYGYEIDWDDPQWESPQPLSVIFDLNNYPYLTDYDNPTGNIKLNPSLKPPQVDEFQISASYSFATDDWGAGYVSLTAVQKNWKNMIDYSAGMNGRVYDGEIEEFFYIKYWDNTSDAERKYKALELVTDYTNGAFHFTGNITWSTLEGNYDSEVEYSPGAAQGINYFNYVGDNDGGNLVKMYDTKDRTPYGYLTGHQPLIINATADYAIPSRGGRTTIGFVYTFASGAHYSNTRVNRRRALNPSLPAEFGTNWTQYKDGKSGEGVFNASAYHDLAITHDFNLFKVSGVQVKAFAKLIIYNFFNHQQLLTWNTAWLSAPASNTDLNHEWTEGPYHGQATGASNFGAPRSFSLSAGVRF
jgi:outer membrane receptor for ferrienterochelin and colicin